MVNKTQREKHFKNNPNDKPLDDWGKKMMRKYHKLKHKFEINDIKHRIKIYLQREQIRADTRIKDTMIEMFPNEYKQALDYVFQTYGMMDKQVMRREKIVKEWRIKPPKIPKW